MVRTLDRAFAGGRMHDILVQLGRPTVCGRRCTFLRERQQVSGQGMMRDHHLSHEQSL